MTELLSLHGHIETRSHQHVTPFPAVWTELIARMPIAAKTSDQFTLSTDAPQSVPLGGLTGADVVVLQLVSGSLSASLTSANGSAQIVPVSSLLLLITKGTPVTALSLTRSPGVPTQVHVLLAQAA